MSVQTTETVGDLAVIASSPDDTTYNDFAEIIDITGMTHIADP